MLSTTTRTAKGAANKEELQLALIRPTLNSHSVTIPDKKASVLPAAQSDISALSPPTGSNMTAYWLQLPLQGPVQSGPVAGSAQRRALWADVQKCNGFPLQKHGSLEQGGSGGEEQGGGLSPSPFTRCFSHRSLHLRGIGGFHSSGPSLISARRSSSISTCTCILKPLQETCDRC